MKHLVDLHGGTIRASSPGLGKGATFVVELPLVEASAATVATTLAARETLARAGGRPDPAALPLRGVRILLVDDEAPAREAMSEMLMLAQATVRVAASAVEATSALATFRPNVLLCDIGMPDEDGYTMLRRVRASTIADGRDVPAIALTAFASDRDVTAARDAGFQMHVAKPVGIDRLTAAIVELMAMPRPGAIPN